MRSGMRWGWALLVAATVRVAGAQGAMTLAQPEASRFPEVRLFVAPTGADGRPLGGLRPEQFRVREDGAAATIEAVQDAGSAVPLEVCLAIDRSGSMADESKLAGAQEAARQFVAAMRPTDRAAVVSFAGGATLDRSLTVDRAGVIAAIGAMSPGGGTTFYDGVYWGVIQVSLRGRWANVLSAGTSGARRVVLALTDGNDNESRATARDVVRQARANGVTLYTIGLGSDASREALEPLAVATGGRYFFAPDASQLAGLYARLAEQLRSEYAITYRSPRPDTDGTRREVKVEVVRAGAGGHTAATLSATGWYQAPGRGSLVVQATAASPDAPSPTEAPAADGPRSSPNALLIGGVLAVGALVVVVRSVRRSLASAAPADAGAASLLPATAATMATHPPVALPVLTVSGVITRIGRADENEVVIDSALVSRRHARIERARGAYRLFDQGSTHGTYVNGRRVTEAAIEVGDVLRFADAEYRFAGEA